MFYYGLWWFIIGLCCLNVCMYVRYKLFECTYVCQIQGEVSKRQIRQHRGDCEDIPLPYYSAQVGVDERAGYPAVYGDLDVLVATSYVATGHATCRLMCAGKRQIECILSLALVYDTYT